LLRNDRVVLLFAGLVLASLSLVAQTAKGPITLDEFMNATDITQVKLSPDGSAAVIATVDSDWQHNRFRNDLWIWKAQTGQTIPLTRSGHARAPQWSPDGKYIAFLSDLPLAEGEEKDTDNVSERLWLIAADSGESFPLYDEKLEAHAFAWSADGSQIFFSCAAPLAKAAEEARKAQWKDVVRWREQERGDLLLAMPWSAARKNPTAHAVSEDAPALPALSRTIAASEDEIKEVAPDPKGTQIAWVTDSVSNRLEDPGTMKSTW
jgi:dipeptidyl aminopeptidase/acylaminoacyl peptidase